MVNLVNTSAELDEYEEQRSAINLTVVVNDQREAKAKSARRPSRTVTKVEPTTESADAAPAVEGPTETATKNLGDALSALLEGRYGGHVVTATKTSEGVTVTSWTLPSGKPAAQKLGLVGETFKTPGQAGVAAFKATNKHFGIPAKLEGRSLTFRAPREVQAE